MGFHPQREPITLYTQSCPQKGFLIRTQMWEELVEKTQISSIAQSVWRWRLLDGGYLSSSLDIKKRVGEQLHFCIIFKKKSSYEALHAQTTYEEPF